MGVEIHDNILRFNPALPAELKSVKFRISFQGHWLNVYADSRQFKVLLEDGVSQTLEIRFIDKVYELRKGKEKVFDLEES